MCLLMIFSVICEVVEMFVDVQSYFQEIEEQMPHFLFYRKDKKKADIYCTACHDRFETAGKAVLSILKHKSDGECPYCHNKVQFRQMDRGRRTYRYYDNFAVFENNGEGVRISCVTVYQSFEEDIMEPVYDYHEAVRYELEKGRSAEYRKSYNCKTNEYEWRQLRRKPKEPLFVSGGFGMGYNGYHVVNFKAIDNSFLCYLFKSEDSYPQMLITWYCRYAEHPQLEYLVHGGLNTLAEAYVEGGINLTRINWNTNDLKKMLRLNKNEIEYLKASEGRDYNAYIHFRRECYCGSDPNETIRYFRDFSYTVSRVLAISRKTGISRKKVMDNALKAKKSEGVTFYLHLWTDYLRECELLEYDLHDEAVAMPKDLAAAHERTAMIIKIESDAMVRKQIEKSNETRKDMRYTDEKRGLVVLVPESVEDIAREGRMLSHCVGGYAQRHAEGKLHILFVRRKDAPDKPYYTMEVDLAGKIVQCRGYKNNMEHNGGVPKPKEIIEFEAEYQEYLTRLFKKMLSGKKTHIKKSA